MKNNNIIMKLFTLIIFSFIICGGLSTTYAEINFKENVKINEKIMNFTKFFSIPEVIEQNNFLNIYFNESNSLLSRSGEPILPVFFETFEFPLGTKIKELNCYPSYFGEMKLSKKIKLTPEPSPMTYESSEDNKIDDNFYFKNQIYPEEIYSYKISGGLNRYNEYTTFLTIQFNPIRYNTFDNIIKYVREINIEIIYEEPINIFIVPDEYDLLIISYDNFAPLLESLIAHKNDHGIKTITVTLNDIYDSTYFPVEGRDNPEKIKYFIRDAIENWGVKYVMLVGNYLKMPIRYVNLEMDKGGIYEELEFISDLYYADIYDSEGSFSSWDTDDDGIYGEWPYPAELIMSDKVDLCPDVYVGRLACMYSFEVEILVDKIIDYEENCYGSNWFNKIIVVGGDTFDERDYGYDTNFDEGIEANKKALEFMDGFNAVKIWTSLGNFSTVNIQNEVSKGAGFLYFCGHGSPRTWGTHENRNHNWTEGIMLKDMLEYTNDGMYPILMVGGCHNSQFDVSLLNLLRDPYHSWYYSTWVPECWSWFSVAKKGGGAIASIGSTGYGAFAIGDWYGNGIPDGIEGFDGWFETQFFRLYNEEKIDILGETYGQLVTDYVNNFPVYTYRWDGKVVETHALFGDPSLKIGGYS
jgi:hypothetical protein